MDLIEVGCIDKVSASHKGLIIEFVTRVFDIRLNNYFYIYYGDKKQYFETISIETTPPTLIKVYARNVGYFRKRIDLCDFDIRDFKGLDVYKINDLELIKQIRRQSLLT